MAQNGSPEEHARLAVEGLQQVRIDTQNIGNLSRRRFVCIQTNSILLAILTCLTICIVTLSRVSNFTDFLFGNCNSGKNENENHATFQNCSFLRS